MFIKGFRNNYVNSIWTPHYRLERPGQKFINDQNQFDSDQSQNHSFDLKNGQAL